MPQSLDKKQRTCISCRKQAPKNELLRIARTQDGISFDKTNKAAGRGAYVCSEDCFRALVGTGKLERALRCKISAENYERIGADIAATVRVV